MLRGGGDWRLCHHRAQADHRHGSQDRAAWRPSDPEGDGGCVKRFEVRRAWAKEWGAAPVYLDLFPR